MLATKLYDLNKGVIYHPDPLLNPKAWDKEHFTFYDKNTKILLDWKLENLYNNWEPKIKTSKVFVLNQEWTLKELDLTDIEIPKDIQNILDNVYENWKDYIMRAVKLKIYDDLSYTISVSVLYWNINKEEDTNNTRDIDNIFNLTFQEFFSTAKHLIDIWKTTIQELDNIVIRETSKYYVNEKLPVKYLPLLAREHFLSADNKSFEPRLWQLYFLYHEPWHKINLAASHRQAWKWGYVSLKWFQYRLSDWTFKKAEDIKIGDKLLASDKKWHTCVTGISLTKEPVYKITLSNWAYYYATTEHQHVTSANYRNWKFWWHYKNTVELQKGDFIPYMNNIKIKWKQENIYKMKLLWYWLWDWTVKHTKTTMSLEISCWNNTWYINKIIKYANYLWLDTRVEKDKRNTNTSVHVYWFDNMKEIYTNKSWTKYIPNFIFGLDKEWKWALLEWLLWSDWYINIKHNWIVNIEYCSKSEELIRWLQILLADVWVICQVKKRFMKTNFNKHYGGDYYWYLYITDRQSILNIFENTDLDHKLNYEKAYNTITTITKLSNSKYSIIPMEAKEEQEKKALWIGSIQYNFQRRKAPYYWLEQWLEYQWVKVIDIQKITEEEVIHIQVDWNHLLWTGWVLTHNSAISALLVFQFLMRKERSDILYLVESNEKIFQPMQYIEKWINKYAKAGLFSISKNDATIKCNVTGNTLKFMSIWARAGIKSFSAPIIMMDEGWFFPSEIFYTVMPIISKPWNKLYVFSTINWDSKKDNTDWFPTLIKQAELWISEYFDSKDILAMRVTIDQNETLGESEKKMYAMIKKNDPARYLADYYWIISWDDNLFDKQKLISPVKAEDYKDWYNVLQCIYWFDPAKSYDYGGLTVSYVIQNKDWSMMLVAVEEHLFKKVDYYDQISHIKNMLLKQKMRNIPTSIIMDWTWVWNAVYEMLAKEITDTRIFRIIYTAGKEATEKNWAFYVPKKDLVDTLVALSSEWKVKIPYDLKELVTQLDTYRKVQNRYEAIGNLHDDQIESFMNTVYLYYTKIEKHLNLLWDWVWKNSNRIKILRNTSAQNRYSKFIY